MSVCKSKSMYVYESMRVNEDVCESVCACVSVSGLSEDVRETVCEWYAKIESVCKSDNV